MQTRLATRLQRQVASGVVNLSVNGKTPIAAWVPSLDTAGNGTTTLTDLVGSNDGTLTNMDAATDWVADTGSGGVRALDFDGVNDRVECPNPVDDWTEITLSSWVYRDTSGWGFLVNTLDTVAQPSDDGFSLYVRNNTGTIDVNLRKGGYISQDATDDGTGLTVGAWHHVAMTWDGSNIRRYLDGVATGTVDATSIPSIGNSGRPLQIGARDIGSSIDLFFNGRLDDIRIFDQALTATDASDLYTAGRGGDAS